MTTRITTIFATLIITLTTVYGQTYEPLDLAKKIFSRDIFPNINNYITRENIGVLTGQNLQKGSTTKFTLLGKTEKTAVVAMTILDTLGKGIDTYLHFRKDTIWKFDALRILQLNKIEQIKLELEKMTPQKVDDIIKLSEKNKNSKDLIIFNSKEEYEFELGNARLTLELDDNIAKHFVTNKTEFERLKNLALTQIEKEKVNEERSLKLIVDLKADYQKIFISSVSSGGYELGNCINFLISNMVDNSVGYLYVKDKKYLPEMNSNGVIMLKEIENGWYIYKTQ